MNKTYANILVALCLLLSVWITSKSISHAGEVAMSGKDPMIALHVTAFLSSVGLVVLSIYIKVKYGK
jgi:hypothetical protein